MDKTRGWLALFGVAMLALGMTLIYPPLGPVTVGAAILVDVYWRGR